MECSFYIWLAKNNAHWTPAAANCMLNDPLKETWNSPSSMSYLKQTTKPVSNAKSIRPVAFINKGNTCYGNSILLADLKIYVNHLEQSPFEFKHFIAISQAISLNMAVRKN